MLQLNYLHHLRDGLGLVKTAKITNNQASSGEKGVILEKQEFLGSPRVGSSARIHKALQWVRLQEPSFPLAMWLYSRSVCSSACPAPTCKTTLLALSLCLTGQWEPMSTNQLRLGRGSNQGGGQISWSNGGLGVVPL